MKFDRKPIWIVFDYFGVIAVDEVLQLIGQGADLAQNQQVEELNKLKDIDFETWIDTSSSVLGVSRERAKSLNNPAQNHDTRLVSYIHALFSAGFEIGVASNSYEQSLHSSIQQAGLSDVVTMIVSSQSINAVKPDPVFWEALIMQTGVDSRDIVMIDDSLQNCEGAGDAGLQSYHYTDFQSFATDCEQLTGVAYA